MKPTLKQKASGRIYNRAIDKFGNTIDFILSEKRAEAAATSFFKQAIDKRQQWRS
jgi:putative transposase